MISKTRHGTCAQWSTISDQDVDHYDDPKRWMFSAWLKLTSKGQQAALKKSR